MKEQQFIAAYEAQWQALEQFFFRQERGLHQHEPWREFPQAYRVLCEQLAYAENAGFSPALLARLQRLAMQGHQLLYRRQRGSGEKVAAYFLYQLPQAVRRWRRRCLSFPSCSRSASGWRGRRLPPRRPRIMRRCMSRGRSGAWARVAARIVMWRCSAII